MSERAGSINVLWCSFSQCIPSRERLVAVARANLVQIGAPSYVRLFFSETWVGSARERASPKVEA
eukprot:3574516-Prymnesium_polylepis.1